MDQCFSRLATQGLHEQVEYVYYIDPTIRIGQRLPPVIERNSMGIQFQLEIFERLIVVNHYIISVARNAQKRINFVLRLCCLLSSTPSYQIAQRP